MGKKSKKTKQLSVAIVEGSSAGEEAHQQQSQPQTPRKRGRPRKIVERTGSEEMKEEEAAEVTESHSKKLKTTVEQQQKHEEEEEEQEQRPEAKTEPEPSSTSIGSMKKGEGQSVAPKEPPTRRTRRKSKPRKSS
ncbi:ABC transporter F family member 4-like isoform X1 [Hibiscus syriacus]|uniref:ABC transporter F family member 4-like isoform X1 n=1 Tax=Hibiscus syriacus TaxID=106335 RepID=UPI00192331F1|nr:ABC transporter F family member 4-like isoform X1 [Hibiscus syriacus]